MKPKRRELMNLTAPELLQTIEKRGARVSVATGDNGALKLQITPNGLVSDLSDEIRRNAHELRDLVESAPVHRWQAAATASTATAIAPDLCPTATPAELAALLAKYRSDGAVLTLERVDCGGARKLALGVELSAGVAVEAHADLFERIERDGLALVRALELEMKTL